MFFSCAHVCEQSESRVNTERVSDVMPPHKCSKNARTAAASVLEENTGAEEEEEGDEETKSFLKDGHELFTSSDKERGEERQRQTDRN